jgi:hypothetical protein
MARKVKFTQITRVEGVGEIIDKLITNTIKQYMQEEKRHHGTDKERLQASDKIRQLNKKRWKLINAINEIIDKDFNEQKEY